MSRIRSWVSGIRDFVSDINPATLSGAIDIIVIRQPDGTLKSSPFHVRFGKLYLLRPKEKVVQITINDEPVRVRMKIGDNGEAFFAPDDESDVMSAAASVGSMSPPPERRQRFVSETSDSERTVVNMDVSAPSASSASSILSSPTPSKPAPSTPPRKVSRASEEAAADVPPDRMETIPRRAPADEEDDTLIEWRWGDLPRTEADARKDAAALKEAAAHAPDGAVMVPHGAVVVPTVGGAAVSGAVMVTGAGALLVPAPESVVSAGPAANTPDPNVPRDAVGVTVTEPDMAAAAAVTEKHAAAHTDSPGLLARIGATLWRSAPLPADDETGVYLHEVRPVDASALAAPQPSPSAAPRAHTPLSPATPVAATPQDSTPLATPQTSVKAPAAGHEHGSPSRGSGVAQQSTAIQPAAEPLCFTVLVTETSSSLGHALAAAAGATTDAALPLATLPSSSTQQPSVATDVPPSEPSQLAALVPTQHSDTSGVCEKPDTVTLPLSPSTSSEAVLEASRTSINTSTTSVSGGSTPDPSLLLAGPSSIADDELPEESEEEQLHNDDLDAVSFHSTHEDADAVTPGLKGELFLDVMEPPPTAPRFTVDNTLSPTDISGGASFPSSPQSHTPTEDRILGPPSLPPLAPPHVALPATHAAASSVASPVQLPNLVLAHLAVRASLCGKANRDYTLAENKQLFDKHAISFEKLNQAPSLFSDPNLVLCIDGKYYPWTIAAPMLLSQMLFQRDLETATLDKLWAAEKRGGWRSFFFGGRDAKNAAAPTPTSVPTPALSPTTAGAIAVAAVDLAGTQAGAAAAMQSVPAAATLVPIPAAAAALSPNSGRARASLRLSSEQLLKLNLREGANKAVFTIISKMQGKQSVQCNIYLWNYDSKIVISDIDGTITRSDVMGHVAAFLSKDWTHTGVANLYTNIEKNGYKFVYLSSRSISHSGPTRDYLKNVKQGQGEAFKLPDGPVLLSPASLMMSIHLEVIRRRPEEFKVSCLRDIKRLFPRCNRARCVCCCTPPLGLESFDACTCLGDSPFTAGFGNRATDELSYRAVGISPFRIFIIDPSSRVRASVGAFRSTYEKLNDVVNEMFPPRRVAAADPVPSFSDTSFWNIPPPAFDESLLRSVNGP